MDGYQKNTHVQSEENGFDGSIYYNEVFKPGIGIDDSCSLFI